MEAADLVAFREQAQAVLEALYPATIELPGHDGEIPCAGGFSAAVGDQLRIGGMVPDYDLAFRVRKSVVPDEPEVGKRLTWQGREWRMHRVASDPSDVAWLIYANSLAE